MQKTEKKYILTGLLGTIAFHLLVLIGFLSYKLGEIKAKPNEMIEVEFAEEEYKTIEQIIKQNNTQVTDYFSLSEQALQNIASNTSEKMNDKISTEKYINDVMKELGIEDMNPKYDNSLPEETVIENETRAEKKKEERVYHFGASRVEYKMSDNRNARQIERPIYKCQGGGTVLVKIVIDQEGRVIEAKIASSSVGDECLAEAALSSASLWLFQSNYNSPKRVEGTISYMFVAQ
jgi:TonB family protein